MRPRETTNEELARLRQDDEAHCAWVAAMDSDERAVLSWPDGCWSEAVMVAMTKRWLLEPLATRERLRMLEYLNSVEDMLHFTPASMAVIEPASDAMAAMFGEAFKVARPDDHGRAFFALLESWPVRWALIAAQPSLLEAIRVARTWSEFTASHTVTPQPERLN